VVSTAVELVSADDVEAEHEIFSSPVVWWYKALLGTPYGGTPAESNDPSSAREASIPVHPKTGFGGPMGP